MTDELKRAIQRPGKRIREFGMRVEKLLQDCVGEAKIEYANDNTALLSNIEKDAVKAFKQGLGNNAIKYHLMAIKRDKFGEIIRVAEDIEEESGSGPESWATPDQPAAIFNVTYTSNGGHGGNQNQGNFAHNEGFKRNFQGDDGNNREKGFQPSGQWQHNTGNQWRTGPRGKKKQRGSGNQRKRG